MKASFISGLVAAMAKARKDKWNATYGHICEICGPDVWHKKCDVALGICDTHMAEILLDAPGQSVVDGEPNRRAASEEVGATPVVEEEYVESE